MQTITPEIRILDLELRESCRRRRLGFAGRARIERERVDVVAHEFAERGINALVAAHQRHACKLRGDDAHAEMTAAVARALVTDVQVAFVGDIELLRVERGLQRRADAFDALAHGSVFLNGRTTTSA
jgi:hypothetical protein